MKKIVFLLVFAASFFSQCSAYEVSLVKPREFDVAHKALIKKSIAQYLNGVETYFDYDQLVCEFLSSPHSFQESYRLVQVTGSKKHQNISGLIVFHKTKGELAIFVFGFGLDRNCATDKSLRPGYLKEALSLVLPTYEFDIATLKVLSYEEFLQSFWHRDNRLLSSKL